MEQAMAAFLDQFGSSETEDRSMQIIRPRSSDLTLYSTMLAIAGCGKVADQHVQAIRRIPDCEIVSLCDRELLMAKQLGERFGISACFSDLGEMLQVCLRMLFISRRRPRAIMRLPNSAWSPEAMSIWKNLLRSQQGRRNR